MIFLTRKYYIIEVLLYLLSDSGMIIEGRVGSKGELFPPKEIRERLGLKPHTKVIYRVEEGS